MKKCLLIGASGYTGSQLAQLIDQHPYLELTTLAVSDGSSVAGMSFNDVFPQYPLSQSKKFLSLNDAHQSSSWSQIDIVILATPHEFSAKWVSEYFKLLGKTVVDLSGAFRLLDKQVFEDNYHFVHPNFDLMKEARYGIPELYSFDQNDKNKCDESNLKDAKLIAVGGCYATASILSLKPLVQLDKINGIPVIHAVSGVSGAGRKAAFTTSFCEVSYQAYGVGQHRHQPEIEQALQTPVIFTPHLAEFKRGISVSVVVPIKNVKDECELTSLFESYYEEHTLVRMTSKLPSIADVTYTPFIDISVRTIRDGSFAQIFCVIDNLMKGAASQAIQCINQAFQFSPIAGLAQETQ